MKELGISDDEDAFIDEDDVEAFKSDDDEQSESPYKIRKLIMVNPAQS